jgi:hypothetical protein
LLDSEDADPMITREAAHAAQRAQGQGPALDRLLDLMAAHKRGLNEVRMIAARNPGDRLLAQLDRRAEACQRAIEIELNLPLLGLPYGSLGQWGENGNAPRIRALLTSALNFERFAKEAA